MNTTTKGIISRNLQKYLDAMGMTQKELAEKIDVSVSSVSLWVLGKTAPRADMVDRICRVFKITRAEFVQDPDALPKGATPPKYIPLYNSIYSEYKYFDDSNVERYITVDQSVKADFGIIVASQSMSEAGIEPRDIAFFAKDYEFVNGRIYAVWIIDNESVILKKVYDDGDRYILMSENSNMAPLSIDKKEIFIIGELFGIYKEWKWEE